jgi:hypothetical protein
MATTNVVVRGTEQCFMDGCILSWVNLPADLNTRIPRTSSIARIQAELSRQIFLPIIEGNASKWVMFRFHSSTIWLYKLFEAAVALKGGLP